LIRSLTACLSVVIIRFSLVRFVFAGEFLGVLDPLPFVHGGLDHRVLAEGPPQAVFLTIVAVGE
jgi:hypothetical protein